MESSDVLEAATSVAERACVLTQSQWDRTDSSQAMAIAEAICVARSRLDAALLKVIPLLNRSEEVFDAGWASPKDYLTHLLGGHKGSGGGLARVVEQLGEVPAVQVALEDGRVSLPQARVIASKIATLPRIGEFQAAVAARMVGLVVEHGLDATDLGRSFDEVVAECDPDAEIMNTEKARSRRERGAHNARFLSFSEDEHGGVRVKGYGTIEDVEAIRATLFPLAAPVRTEPGACGGQARRVGEPMFDKDGVSTRVDCPDPGCAHDGRDYRDGGARLWDALVEACDQLRATDTLPRDHGSPVRLMVRIDHDSLRQEVIDSGLAATGETTSGGRLSASAVRRMACDAEIIPAVLGAEAQVLDVGRTRRLVTPQIWMALIARDKHCAFPGCNRLPLACDGHHIKHWADGGQTSLDNMIMLCRHHHTVVHERPWAVRIDPDTRQPVWIPPPKQRLADWAGKITYVPADRSWPGVKPQAA